MSIAVSDTLSVAEPAAAPDATAGAAVPGSAPMTPDFARRFGGLERLYGVDGAARLRQAHVLVAGIGGVGSWAV